MGRYWPHGNRGRAIVILGGAVTILVIAGGTALAVSKLSTPPQAARLMPSPSLLATPSPSPSPTNTPVPLGVGGGGGLGSPSASPSDVATPTPSPSPTPIWIGTVPTYGSSGSPLAFDPKSASMIMVSLRQFGYPGPVAAIGVQSRTWRWTGEKWIDAGDAPMNVIGGMVYVPSIGKRVMMTDGETGAPYQAMAWDGVSWSAISSPGGSAGILMAVDVARAQLLALTTTATWTFDGTTWTQVASVGPTEVRQGSLAYDPRSRKVLFFGKTCQDNYCESNATWAWDGGTWTQLHPATQPPGATSAQLGYDGSQMLMIDQHQTARNGNDFETTMWSWDGADWVPLHPTTLPPWGGYMNMAVDASRHELMLVQAATGGGMLPASQTWIYGNGNWRKAA